MEDPPSFSFHFSHRQTELTFAQLQVLLISKIIDEKTFKS
ncbi:unnamed protein product, partial [marine sediment metagenome]